MMKFQFSAVFKRCHLQLGYSQFKFLSHSFCIGATTEAVILGLDEAVIMKLGRWQSRRFNIYIRPN